MFAMRFYNSQQIFIKFSFPDSPWKYPGLDWKKIRKNPESGEKSGIFYQNVLLHNGVYSTIGPSVRWKILNVTVNKLKIYIETIEILFLIIICLKNSVLYVKIHFQNCKLTCYLSLSAILCSKMAIFRVKFPDCGSMCAIHVICYHYI